MQEEGPRCCARQEGRLQLQLPLLLSAELWAETSGSHLCSSSPCCHSGDTRSRSVQIRQEHIVCFGRQAESAAQSPRTGKGWQRMSFGEGFSRAAGHEVAFPLAGLPREAEQHICSGPSTILVVWEGENPLCFLLLGAFWYSWEQTLTRCVGFVLQTFCCGYTWVFKTPLQQQSWKSSKQQVGKIKATAGKLSCEAYKAVTLENQMKNWLHVLNAFQKLCCICARCWAAVTWNMTQC